MDSYYKGTISATKALITAQSKLNKNVVKDSSGIWKVKEGVDGLTEGTEEYTKAAETAS
mgnify:FL=1